MLQSRSSWEMIEERTFHSISQIMRLTPTSMSWGIRFKKNIKNKTRTWQECQCHFFRYSVHVSGVFCASVQYALAREWIMLHMIWLWMLLTRMHKLLTRIIPVEDITTAEVSISSGNKNTSKSAVNLHQETKNHSANSAIQLPLACHVDRV